MNVDRRVGDRTQPEDVSELARFVSAIIARRKRLYYYYNVMYNYYLAQGSSHFPTSHVFTLYLDMLRETLSIS